jgi:hypothetical protein
LTRGNMNLAYFDFKQGGNMNLAYFDFKQAHR